MVSRNEQDLVEILAQLLQSKLQSVTITESADVTSQNDIRSASGNFCGVVLLCLLVKKAPPVEVRHELYGYDEVW